MAPSLPTASGHAVLPQGQVPGVAEGEAPPRGTPWAPVCGLRWVGETEGRYVDVVRPKRPWQDFVEEEGAVGPEGAEPASWGEAHSAPS